MKTLERHSRMRKDEKSFSQKNIIHTSPGRNDVTGEREIQQNLGGPHKQKREKPVRAVGSLKKTEDSLCWNVSVYLYTRPVTLVEN